MPAAASDAASFPNLNEGDKEKWKNYLSLFGYNPASDTSFVLNPWYWYTFCGSHTLYDEHKYYALVIPEQRWLTDDPTQGQDYGIGRTVSLGSGIGSQFVQIFAWKEVKAHTVLWIKAVLRGHPGNGDVDLWLPFTV